MIVQIDSKLEKLKLAGNFLKNEGVFNLFKALEYNNMLEKIGIIQLIIIIDLSDN
jgi:hypothetical protein